MDVVACLLKTVGFVFSIIIHCISVSNISKCSSFSGGVPDLSDNFEGSFGLSPQEKNAHASTHSCP